MKKIILILISIFLSNNVSSQITKTKIAQKDELKKNFEQAENKIKQLQKENTELKNELSKNGGN